MATREVLIANMQAALERARTDPNIKPFVAIKLEKDIDRLLKFTPVTLDMQIADIQEEISYLTPGADDAIMRFLTAKLADLKAKKTILDK